MRTNTSVRAIVPDEEGMLALIKRIRPGWDPYWVLPGGGVEEDDVDLVGALRRELREELGAEVDVGGKEMTYVERDITTHVFRARIVSMDSARRHGPELDDPDPVRGSYEVVHVAPTQGEIDRINLVPDWLRSACVTGAA